MLAERLTDGVGELGLGSFQHPGKLGSIRFAGVDLISHGMHLQEEVLVRRRLQFPWNLLCVGAERKKEARCQGRRYGY